MAHEWKRCGLLRFDSGVRTVWKRPRDDRESGFVFQSTRNPDIEPAPGCGGYYDAHGMARSAGGRLELTED